MLERLERIDAMRREAAGPTELLGELRRLLHEAEAWTRAEGDERSGRAVEALRASLVQEATTA